MTDTEYLERIALEAQSVESTDDYGDFADAVLGLIDDWEKRRRGRTD